MSLCIMLFLSCGIHAQVERVDQFTGVANSDMIALVPTDDGGWITIYCQPESPANSVIALVLDKYDHCGVLMGSSQYVFQEEPKIAIRNVVNHEGEGTFYLLLASYDGDDYALICQFDHEGQLVRHTTLRNPDDFYAVYTMAENTDGDLCIYGNTSGISTITILNEDLTIHSLHGVHRSAVWGTFLPTSDGGYLCRNGNEYYKIDDRFMLVWGRRYEHLEGTYAPLELDDGYVFSVFAYGSTDRRSHLIKLDKLTGEIIWNSPNVLGSTYNHLRRLNNGSLIQLGGVVIDSTSRTLMQIALFDPRTGDLIEEHIYSPPTSSAYAAADIIERPGNQIVILGHSRFILDIVQVITTQDFAENCMTTFFDKTESVEPILSETITLRPAAYSMETRISPVQQVPNKVTIQTLCKKSPFHPFVSSVDTILCEGDTLTVHYTDWTHELVWTDGSMQKRRTLQAPFEQEVTFTYCAEDTTIGVRVDSMDCDCSMYLPTAFSPNNDGVNDVYQVFTNCSLTQYHMQIYDRFGARVFETRDIQEAWNGVASTGQRCAQASYVVVVDFFYQRGLQVVHDYKKSELHLIR